MPYAGEHPDQNGWPAAGVGPFEPLVIDGMIFPDGCRQGHSIIWQRVWAVLKSGVPGGLYRPGSTWDGQTQSGGDWTVLDYPDGLHWEQYGGELREKRGQAAQSIHSWWIACDFNSGHNPSQADVPDPSPWRLPPDTQERLDAEFGPGAFLWGGDPDWGDRKDWMHIQMQLTPDEATALAATLQGLPTTSISNPIALANPGDASMSAQDVTDLKSYIDTQMVALTTQLAGVRNNTQAEIRATSGHLAAIVTAEVRGGSNAVIAAVNRVGGQLFALAGKIATKVGAK